MGEAVTVAGRVFDWKNLTITIGNTKTMHHDICNGLVITEIRIWPVTDPDASRLKAKCSITFNEVIRINSCRLIEGARGLFLSWPAEKRPGSEDWYSLAHAITREGSDKITEAVVKTWKEMLAAVGQAG